MKNNPLIPMCAISSLLTDRETDDFIESHYAVGISQILFYERGACAECVDYMSEDWLAQCERVLLAAARRGMKVWLYDEFDCPSGTCHGAVMKADAAHRAKYVSVSAGRCEIKSCDGYADILNPAVTDQFLARTHEVYYARFGAYFGSTVVGIFTDEPSFAYSNGNQPYSRGEANGVREYAYTDSLPTLYNAETGRDFFTDVLTADKSFLKVYYDLVGRLFRENYIRRINDWCLAHGILLTGHLYDEFDIRHSVCASGDAIAALRGFSMPGMDEIFTRIDTENAEWLTLGTIAAAHTPDGTLAELAALGPSDQPPERTLQMIRLAALFGVSRYVIAISPADARETYKKREWFHPVNYMQPWYAGAALLGAAAQKAAELACKTPVPEICIRFPVVAASENSNDAAGINETLLGLIRELVRNQYQWQLLDSGDCPPSGALLTVDYDTPINEILKTVPRRVTVTNPDGPLAQEVLLRRYTDKTVCVLDLTDHDGARRLVLNDNGKKTPITLYSRGLYVAGEGLAELAVLRRESPTFAVSRDAKNTLRCVFAQDGVPFRFRTQTALDAIRLCRRAYQYEATVTLDGKPIAFTDECVDLPQGMRGLYLESAPLALAAGEHTVTVSAPAYNEPYLPAVFVTGDFSSDETDRLGPAVTTVGCGSLRGVCPQFSGKITFSTLLTVPQTDEPVFLNFNSFGNYTRVYFDGEPAGEAFVKPYLFAVPDRLRGRGTRVTIEQFTTIGPLYGRADDVLKGMAPGQTLYDYFPGKYADSGITDLCWVTRK